MQIMADPSHQAEMASDLGQLVSGHDPFTDGQHAPSKMVFSFFYCPSSHRCIACLVFRPGSTPATRSSDTWTYVRLLFTAPAFRRMHFASRLLHWLCLIHGNEPIFLDAASIAGVPEINADEKVSKTIRLGFYTKLLFHKAEEITAGESGPIPVCIRLPILISELTTAESERKSLRRRSWILQLTEEQLSPKKAVRNQFECPFKHIYALGDRAVEHALQMREKQWHNLKVYFEQLKFPTNEEMDDRLKQEKSSQSHVKH